MKEADKIDIHSLQERAKKSEKNEAFTVLAKSGSCRIGVGTRLKSPAKPTFFIEVLMSLCTGHGILDLELMEKKVFLLSRLKERGYMLYCEEDGCVSCELTVPSKNLIMEYEASISIIKERR